MNEYVRLRNPLDTLATFCDSLPDDIEPLFVARADTFYGPDATFTAAVLHTESPDAATLRGVLRSIRDAVEQFPDVSAITWNRLWQLALLYVHAPNDEHGLSFDLNEASGLFDESDASIDVKPAPKEMELFERAIEVLRRHSWDKNENTWTAADWRLLAFINDASTSSRGLIERTPIFLANEQLGNVLTLVGERLPGPPRLITPHWWRLGLVPLGKNDELLKQIHAGFQAVLGACPEERYQLRWWLEASAVGGGWHKDISEAASVQVSAACVANALRQRKSGSPPLLDPKAGASGKLGGVAGTPLHDRSVGAVGFIDKKIDAAHGAGLLTFGLEDSCAKKYLRGEPPQVQPVKTFSDAFEALLATTTHLQRYKANQAADAFIPIYDTESTASKDGTTKIHIEVDTHPDFFVEEERDTSQTVEQKAERERLAEKIEQRFTQAPGAEHFLLRQPIWYAEAPQHNVRWNMAEREEEPTDKASKLEPAHRPAPNEQDKPVPDGEEKWTRMDRAQVLEHAISDEPAWRRVGLVCGAGLGKTTNLQWLAAAINRQHDGRGKNLAVFLELSELGKVLKPASEKDAATSMKAWIVHEINNRVDDSKGLTSFAVERLLADGRVTFLLDSLDQANPDPKGEAVVALRELLVGRWSNCRVWVSGRPYAFRIARKALEEIERNPPWQFLRIGQLDEPECRQLLETFRRPGAA